MEAKKKMERMSKNYKHVSRSKEKYQKYSNVSQTSSEILQNVKKHNWFEENLRKL